jgi:hypothetical protein
MPKAGTERRARAPQGAKRVAQAFLDELSTIAEDRQAEAGKAAQAMIRETLIARREKARAAKARQRPLKAAAKGKGPSNVERATRRSTSTPKTSRQRGSSDKGAAAVQEAVEPGGES